MKLIFALLVILNIAVAAWYFSSEPASVSVFQAPVDVGDIMIVSDVELQARAEFQAKSRVQQQEETTPFDEELPRPELDAFIFDETTEQLVCRQLGPFEERSDAVDIATGLAAYHIAASVKRTTTTKIVGYWAILPARSSRSESNALVDELRAKGFRDVRRFLTGEMENAISLGLFSTEINAVKRTRAFEKQGYIPIVKAKENETLHYWLEFEQSAGFKLPMKQIHETFPQVKIKACSGIAPD